MSWLGRSPKEKKATPEYPHLKSRRENIVTTLGRLFSALERKAKRKLAGVKRELWTLFALPDAPKNTAPQKNYILEKEQVVVLGETIEWGYVLTTKNGEYIDSYDKVFDFGLDSGVIFACKSWNPYREIFAITPSGVRIKYEKFSPEIVAILEEKLPSEYRFLLQS